MAPNTFPVAPIKSDALHERATIGRAAAVFAHEVAADRIQVLKRVEARQVEPPRRVERCDIRVALLEECLQLELAGGAGGERHVGVHVGAHHEYARSPRQLVVREHSDAERILRAEAHIFASWSSEDVLLAKLSAVGW